MYSDFIDSLNMSCRATRSYITGKIYRVSAAANVVYLWNIYTSSKKWAERMYKHHVEDRGSSPHKSTPQTI